MQRIALLGGTFDPIHIAHLRTAVELLNMGFDQVRLIPNATPPHRPQPVASALQRIEMLRLATASIAGVVIDDIELKRSDISYTADTVIEYRQMFTPEDCISWVMGRDAWMGFDRWHQPEQILQQVNVVVVDRITEDLITLPKAQENWLNQRHCALEQLLNTAAGAIAEVQCPLLEVSATNVRELLAQNKQVDFLLPQTVIEYIKQNGLYS